MLCLVKTVSTFENVYLVEAGSESEARLAVMEDGTPPDFLQKHQGEKVTEVYEVHESRPAITTTLRKNGYI